ncbi:hypothetical protein [Hymenobacter sp. DG25A]|uniref:hypothetical protein n=1 Tax=Hymenobacter sp. DG25A TaxID=1385663 RepID=UPI001E5DCF32|nr:hypothetical protein [Hymenobacter sp. DG25A]
MSALSLWKRCRASADSNPVFLRCRPIRATVVAHDNVFLEQLCVERIIELG